MSTYLHFTSPMVLVSYLSNFPVLHKVPEYNTHPKCSLKLAISDVITKHT